MLNDSIGTITERIANNYGKDELKLLKEWKFTAADLNKLDGDRYAYLVAIRGEEVQGVLDAPAVTAKRKLAKTSDELSVFYAECRNGKHSPNDIANWLAENFENDFEAFNRDFPQVAADDIPSNMAAITFDVTQRRVYPNYDELVKSFGRLAVPDKGYPSLTLKCGDDYLTGKPLRDYIHSHPLEMLEPSKSTNPPAHETQSAAEFLATDPTLRSVKTEQPLLLRERFNKEWGNFLVCDIGRNLAARADQYGLGSFLPGYMWEHMVKNQIPFHQKGFEQAALAVAAKITIHTSDGESAPLVLANEDIGGAKSGVTTIHDGGGDHYKQIPLGLTTAGQSVPSPYNPDHEWTEQSLRRELRRLTADQYKERLGDVAFVRALDKFKLR